MKQLNKILAVGLAAMIPLSAWADRNPQRCGNDRSYSSWGRNYGGGNGQIYGNPYQPRPFNYGNWNTGNWNTGGWGNGSGGGRYGVFGVNNIVRNGVRSGSLSRDEVRDIRDDQRDIRRKEQAYWSDGRLTSGERKDLRGDYKDMYKDIRHNLNDGEKRW